ncbi:MAG: Gfo/Idh/MocA family oxidoreductase [Candidatus Vogelbacteria bacterium]|nr:Gfo/Idh/MocA family oxidoreductase [Candidatus Vogelbacteria bacterium]
MTTPIKLGVIGTGKHAMQSHITVAFAEPSLFEVTALYDINRPAIDKIVSDGKNWGHKNLRAAKSAEDLLTSSDIDAVLIATPPDSHLLYLEGAIKAKKHILCEKPIWNGTAETLKAVELMNLAKEQRLVLTSCHPRRFEPPYIEVKRRLEEYKTKFGALREIVFRFFYHVPPKGGWRETDSLLLDHMNHEIDLVNYLIGHGTVTLRKNFDSFDRYSVTGYRLEKDGPSISFAGYRKLDTKVYRNELELVFDKGRVLVLSTLMNGRVNSRIEETNFDHVGSSTIHVSNHEVHVPFEGIMKNFAGAIQKTATNYLDTCDLAYNNSSANLLAEKSELLNFHL